MIDQSPEAVDVKHSLEALFKEVRRRESCGAFHPIEQCREAQDLVCAIDLLINRAKGVEYDRDDLRGHFDRARENERRQQKVVEGCNEEIQKLRRENQQLRDHLERLRKGKGDAAR